MKTGNFEGQCWYDFCWWFARRPQYLRSHVSYTVTSTLHEAGWNMSCDIQVSSYPEHTHHEVSLRAPKTETPRQHGGRLFMVHNTRQNGTVISIRVLVGTQWPYRNEA